MFVPPFEFFRKHLGLAFNDQDQGASVSIPFSVFAALMKGNLQSTEFEEKRYLDLNHDVGEALRKGHFANGQDHFLSSGYFTGRKGAIDFDENYYLARYPDVRRAVLSKSFKSAEDHYYTVGCVEGRSPNKNTETVVAYWSSLFQEKYLTFLPNKEKSTLVTQSHAVANKETFLSEDTESLHPRPVAGRVRFLKRLIGS